MVMSLNHALTYNIITMHVCYSHTCTLWSSPSFCFNADCNRSTAEADAIDPSPVEYPSNDIERS